MYKNSFYIPSKEDHFYTLLSHTIMKKHIRDDYKLMLYEIGSTLELGQNIDPILNDFSKAKNFLKTYMKNMGYHFPTIDREILYKIRHTELMRLFTTSIFITKKYGIRFLLLKIK